MRQLARMLGLAIAMQLVLAIWLIVSRISILDDIWGFLTGIPKTIGDVISGIWHGIQAVFHGAETIFSAVWDAWVWMYNGIIWLGETAVEVVDDVVKGIRWLIFDAIPTVADWVARFAWKLVDDAINGIEYLIKKTADFIVNAILTVIHTVEHWAKQAIHILGSALDSLIHLIDTVGLFVFDLVTHPVKLIEWIWTALLEKVLGAFWTVVKLLTHFLWDAIRSDVRGFIHAVEDVVSIIL